MADLRVIDAEPRGKGVLGILDEYRKQARNGEVSSIAVVIVHADGAASWNWSEAPNISTLIGGIERMKADMIRTVDDED